MFATMSSSRIKAQFAPHGVLYFQPAEEKELRISFFCVIIHTYEYINGLVVFIPSYMAT